jgi:quinol monooxygenase YgiN
MSSFLTNHLAEDTSDAQHHGHHPHQTGHDKTMHDALLAVAANARANEPDTLDFFVSQGSGDRCVFTTYERFADEAAMDRHNTSAVVERFFRSAKPILDGDVTQVTCSELFAKR